METLHESMLYESIVKLLNRHSAENESNTPDWILAQFLLGCLRAFNQATNDRTQSITGEVISTETES